MPCTSNDKRAGAELVESVDQDLALQRHVVGDVALGIASYFAAKQLQQRLRTKRLDRTTC